MSLSCACERAHPPRLVVLTGGPGAGKTALLEIIRSSFCRDRGTLDGAAYWPGEPAAFFEELGLERDRELARYAAVIHLRPPGHDHGYQPTTVRTESALQAAAIDNRIYAAWDGHPHRTVVESHRDVLRKLARGIALIREHVPACCRR